MAPVPDESTLVPEGEDKTLKSVNWQRGHTFGWNLNQWPEGQLKDGDYWDGYKTAIQGARMARRISDYEASVLTGDVVSAKKEQDPHEGRSDEWKRGYQRGIRLRKWSPALRQEGDYWDGYWVGVQEKNAEGFLNPNTVRDLLNMPRLGGVSTESVEDGPKFDPVKIPSHYNSGQIEVTNFISDQQLNFARGNVVKYVARAGKKDPDKELQDLEKAAAYLQMAYNLAQGLPAVIRDPETKEVVWSLFKN